MKIRDRIKELRRVKASDLLRNPRNWPRHTRAQAAALKGLLAEIGFADALIARELPDRRLEIIDGHLRAETTPDTFVPVLVLDVSEEEANKLLLSLDPLAAMAETDSERLTALLQSVHTDDEAVQELFRRTAGDRLWDEIFPREIVAPEVSLDQAAQFQRKWGTQPGQIWDDGQNRVACCDSRDSTAVGELFDGEILAQLIVTDPPYGDCYSDKNRTLNKSDHGNRIQKPIANDHLSEVETGALFQDSLALAAGYCKPGATLYPSVPGGPLLVHFIGALEGAGFSFRSTLVWIKDSFVLGMSDYHFRHELILYGWLRNGPHFWNGGRSQDSVFQVDRPRVSDLHPTQKPTPLLARMIANSSRPGDLVYDPFGGSGATILAAHQLGRRGFACEVDPGYVAVTLERLSMLGLRPELVK